MATPVAGLGCAPSSDASLAQWFDAHAKDVPSIDPLDDQRGLVQALDGAVNDDAVVVGVGESAHGTREYSELRAKAFQYLIAQHGIRCIVPETGLMEARLVEQYVTGAQISLEDVMKNGWTHHMGLDTGALALVEWMRAYNQGKDPSQQVHFGGKDLSALGDTLTVPLEPVAAYLTKVDPDYAHSTPFVHTMSLVRAASAVPLAAEAAFRAQGAPGIEPDYLDAFTTIGFEQLSKEDQQQLATGVQTIADQLRDHAAAYGTASSKDDYEWHAQLAVVGTQIVRDLRSRQLHPKIDAYQKVVAMLATAAPDVVVDTRPASDPASHTIDYSNEDQLRDYFLGRNTRERALAENVLWQAQRCGKVMNYAHNTHLIKVAQHVAVVGDVAVHNPGANEGSFLAEALGPRYVLLGTTNISFTDEAGRPANMFHGAPVVEVADAPSSLEFEIEPAVRDHALGLFVDFAHADDLDAVRGQLGNRLMRWQSDFQELDVLGNFDGLIVLSTIGPAIPNQFAQ